MEACHRESRCPARACMISMKRAPGAIAWACDPLPSTWATSAQPCARRAHSYSRTADATSSESPSRGNAAMAPLRGSCLVFDLEACVEEVPRLLPLASLSSCAGDAPSCSGRRVGNLRTRAPRAAGRQPSLVLNLASLGEGEVVTQRLSLDRAIADAQTALLAFLASGMHRARALPSASRRLIAGGVSGGPGLWEVLHNAHVPDLEVYAELKSGTVAMSVQRMAGRSVPKGGLVMDLPA